MKLQWFTVPIGHLMILPRVGYTKLSFWGFSHGDWVVGLGRCRKDPTTPPYRPEDFCGHQDSASDTRRTPSSD